MDNAFLYVTNNTSSTVSVIDLNRNSLIPDLRTIKIQSQANFVNPGLWLFNTGFDMDLTPKLRMINNANFLMFDKTATLETFLFDGHIDREIGVDLSSGFEYRPLLSNNVIFTFGVSTLLPGRGFKQLYNRFLRGETTDPRMGDRGKLVAPLARQALAVLGEPVSD